MEYTQRPYPLFSACGLNCGLCPRYQMEGPSKCPGCAGAGFLTKHPTCGVLSCSQRHGLDYCYECAEYPCKKYEGADASDSFISHLNQLRDMEKAKTMGLDAYRAELDEKVDILQNLLENYNEGRRKNFYCMAVNLLELPDVKDVMAKIADEVPAEAPVKEKAATAVRLFQAAADERGILLKLRKK